ncbi:hypothetical protein NSS60_10300 [Anoxybacillus sp. FSL W8-0382]|uniref:hypothetical protein n=1 Tax=Anoxybacillus sp. FSL W8-0382 TaxID=2954700 RepID=UPI0030F886CF
MWGVDSAAKAPTFRPNVPNCRVNVWIWQYGRDADLCPIDTNVANRKVSEYLY